LDVVGEAGAMAFTQAVGAEALCRSGHAAPTSLCPAAPRSVQLPDLCTPLLAGALQRCIAAAKGGSRTRPPATYISAPPLHSSKVQNEGSGILNCLCYFLSKFSSTAMSMFSFNISSNSPCFFQAGCFVVISQCGCLIVCTL